MIDNTNKAEAVAKLVVIGKKLHEAQKAFLTNVTPGTFTRREKTVIAKLWDKVDGVVRHIDQIADLNLVEPIIKKRLEGENTSAVSVEPAASEKPAATPPKKAPHETKSIGKAKPGKGVGRYKV